MFLPDPRMGLPELLDRRNPTEMLIADLSSFLFDGLVMFCANSCSHIDRQGHGTKFTTLKLPFRAGRFVTTTANQKTDGVKIPTDTGLDDLFTITAEINVLSQPTFQLAAGMGNYDGSVEWIRSERAINMWKGHWYFWGANIDYDTGVAVDIGRSIVSFTNDGSTLRFYLNGERRYSVDTSSIAWNTTAAEFNIGFAHKNVGVYGDTEIFLGVAHNRALDAAEIRALHQNPYQYLAPAS